MLSSIRRYSVQGYHRKLLTNVRELNYVQCSIVRQGEDGGHAKHPAPALTLVVRVSTAEGKQRGSRRTYTLKLLYPFREPVFQASFRQTGPRLMRRAMDR